MFDSDILSASEYESLQKYCGGVSHSIGSAIQVDVVGDITGSVGEEEIESVVELSYLKRVGLVENSNYHVIKRCDGLKVHGKELEFIRFYRRWVVGNGVEYVLLFRVL